MCSKVLNGHIILTDTSITTILAPEMTYTPKNTAGVVQNIPKDAFVSFERTRNGSRIGSVSVTADGQYELRLRKEYEFNWYTDEVELHYTGDGGMVYHATYPSLSSLFASPHIVLEPSAGE